MLRKLVVGLVGAVVLAGSLLTVAAAQEAKKDAAARAELVAGLERKLAQDDKALVVNKGFRRFLKTPEGDGFVIDRAKVEADARLDGLFVLRTNTCSPPARSSIRPTPASAAMSSASSSRWSCARN